MSRSDAADHWAAACHRWAEEHMGDHDGLPRLAELIGKINASADVAGASSFAAWRTRPPVDRLPSSEARIACFGIAVVAARADFLAAFPWIERVVAPLEVGVFAHATTSTRPPG